MSPYWCSSREHGNKSSPGIVLHTGAHHGDLGARLALGVNSVLVLTRRAENKASHELALCTGAQQGSLGTRLTQGLYSALVLTRGAWERG